MTREESGRNEEKSQFLQFHEVGRQLRRRWTLLVLVVATSLGAGMLYLQSASPSYRTTTRLLVRRHSGQWDPKSSHRHDPAFIATQAEIVHSRMVAENALAVCLPSCLAGASDPVADVLSAIRVTPVEGTNVMQISYVGSNAAENEKMLAAVIASYQDFLHNTEQGSRRRATTLLERNEKELREQLQQEETRYRGLLTTGVLSPIGDDAIRVQTAFLTSLGKALTEAKNRRLQMENESMTGVATVGDSRSPRPLEFVHTMPRDVSTLWAQAAFSGEESPVVAMPPGSDLDIRKIVNELQEACRLEQELTTRFGPKHPEVRTVRARKRLLQARHDDMLSEIPKLLERKIRMARNHEQELQVLYEKELQRATQLGAQKLEHDQYLARIDRLRSAQSSLLTKLHAQQIASQSTLRGQSTVEVETITPPKSTVSPVWPVPVVVLSIFGVLGLGVGVGLSLWLENAPFRRGRVIPGRSLRQGVFRRYPEQNLVE